MPIGVPVTFRDYVVMKKYLEELGFREMSRSEVRDEVITHNLGIYKKTTEAEKGFVYTNKLLRVKVWTSCERSRVERCYAELAVHPLLKEAIGDEVVSRPTNEDMGWNLITDLDNNEQYFAVPFNRTENFAVSLCKQTRITQLRVQNRPRCEKCHEFMAIVVRRNRQTYWKCLKGCRHATGKSVTVGWDAVLPPKAKVAAEERRKSRAKRRKKERAEGIVRTPAREIRARRNAIKRAA